MGSELLHWWTEYVPRFMRTWPWLRRYFWQADEIAEMERRAEELHKFFNPTGGPDGTAG